MLTTRLQPLARALLVLSVYGSVVFHTDRTQYIVHHVLTPPRPTGACIPTISERITGSNDDGSVAQENFPCAQCAIRWYISLYRSYCPHFLTLLDFDVRLTKLTFSVSPITCPLLPLYPRFSLCLYRSSDGFCRLVNLFPSLSLFQPMYVLNHKLRIACEKHLNQYRMVDRF